MSHSLIFTIVLLLYVRTSQWHECCMIKLIGVSRLRIVLITVSRTGKIFQNYLFSFTRKMVHSVNLNPWYFWFIHYMSAARGEQLLIQECIPVGCVPPACWPYPRMHCAGGGGLCQGGVSAQGGCVSVFPGVADPPRGQNDRQVLKTLPCRNFIAGGNYAVRPLFRNWLISDFVSREKQCHLVSTYVTYYLSRDSLLVAVDPRAN